MHSKAVLSPLTRGEQLMLAQNLCVKCKKTMIIDIFGKEVEVVRREPEWVVFYRGNEGKKRLANDIVIPSNIKETELVKYLSDIYHEHSTKRHPEVKILG